MASDPSTRTDEIAPIEIPGMQLPEGTDLGEQREAWEGAAQDRGGLGPNEEITAVPSGGQPPPGGWTNEGSYTPEGSSQSYDIYTRETQSGGPTEITINGPGTIGPPEDGPMPGDAGGDGSAPGQGPLEDTEKDFPPEAEVGGTTAPCPVPTTPLEEALEVGQGVLEGMAIGAAAAVAVGALAGLVGAAAAPFVLGGIAIAGGLMLGAEILDLATNPDISPSDARKRWGRLAGGFLIPAARLGTLGSKLGSGFRGKIPGLGPKVPPEVPGGVKPPANEPPAGGGKPPANEPPAGGGKPPANEPPGGSKPGEGSKPSARERLEARREANRMKDLKERIRDAEKNGKLKELSKEDQDFLNSNPRNKELAYDPDTGSFKPNEARAALAAEQNGQLPGPVRRDYEVNNRSTGGDIVDGNGKVWDVKDASAGAKQIQDVAAPVRGKPGENVLIDASKLSAGERAALQAELDANHIPGSGSIIMSPPAPPPIGNVSPLVPGGAAAGLPDNQKKN